MAASRRHGSRALVAVAIALSLVPVALARNAPNLAPSDAGRLADIGRGAGVVFSPDFSVPTNSLFYERLGFAYFEDASWARVLDRIDQRNSVPSRRIETLVVMCHGANGNGLKLQTSKLPTAPRSYVSMGGLQERLGRAGVRNVILVACNTGRLFRPEIYARLDETVRDPLFLPPTRGIVNGSPGFDPSCSEVAVFRRAESIKENAMEGYVADLSPATRRALGMAGGRFVITDLFMQLLLQDASAELTADGYATDISTEKPSNLRSDEIYRRFVALLDRVAARSNSRG